MIGITLVEDLAVVALTVLLPSLKNISGGHLFSLGIGLVVCFTIPHELPSLSGLD
jgi:hypothetical protein